MYATRVFIFSIALLFATGQGALIYSVSSLDDGNVLCTLTNSGENTEKVLMYNTPFEKYILGPIFTVTDARGRNAQYVGKVGRRVFPAPESSYLTLNAGESVSAVVNIHNIYNVHETGIYTITAKVPSTLRAIIGHSASQLLQKTQNIHKSSSKAVLENYYLGCDENEQSIIEESRAVGERSVYEAYQCMTENSCDSFTTKWIGAREDLNSDNYDKVQEMFEKMRIPIANIVADCQRLECGEDLFAFVYPSDPNQVIYLCDSYWNAENPSERPITVVHEYSHFEVIGGTDDFSYGEEDCLALAVSDSDKAALNADNVAYLANDILENLEITYSILPNTNTRTTLTFSWYYDYIYSDYKNSTQENDSSVASFLPIPLLLIVLLIIQ